MIRTVIVEDSEAMCLVWREMLSRIRGVKLIGMYEEPSSAVQAIRRDPPDLILLDIELGAESGSEVLRQALEANPQTKVIVCSNHADKIFRKHYINAGAYAFFDKSHEFHKLRGTVLKLAEEAHYERA